MNTTAGPATPAARSTAVPQQAGPQQAGPRHARPAPPLRELRARLTGRLALPGEELHTRLATPWNLAVTPRPAAVVEAATAEDVADAIAFAGHHGMPVAVQCTGHGTAATMEGALLVHTGRLDECRVSADGTARVGAGVRWQRVLDEAAPHGLAPLCGSAPHVGVVGYTTGGGLGPVARTYGAASDRVTAVELVTGDGVLRRATATHHPELFWGVRGGKGALGIVTALEFGLVPLAELYAGAVYWGGADARAVLHAWRAWCAALPEQATTSIALLQLPPLPMVPPPLAGRLTVAVRFAWTGGPAEGERLLAPLRDAAPVLLDAMGTIPYAGIGAVHADPVDPMPASEAHCLLRQLPAAAVDALLGVAGPGSGSPEVVVELRQLGGAIARGGAAPSAFSHRDAAFSLLVVGVPAGPGAEQVVAHGGSVVDALQDWAHPGLLPNFASTGDPDRTARCYSPTSLRWLVELAAQYDPVGVLSVGQVPRRR